METRHKEKEETFLTASNHRVCLNGADGHHRVLLPANRSGEKGKIECMHSDSSGVTVDVLDRVSIHKWLGCLLHTGGCHDADIDFHLQAALRTFNAYRRRLTDRHVSLATRLRYFDTIITPVVCFAAGHRTILTKDLNKIDVTFRKLLRSAVGPPAATVARVVQFVEQYSVKHW